jgi:hypothetical protein
LRRVPWCLHLIVPLHFRGQVVRVDRDGDVALWCRSCRPHPHSHNEDGRQHNDREKRHTNHAANKGRPSSAAIKRRVGHVHLSFRGVAAHERPNAWLQAEATCDEELVAAFCNLPPLSIRWHEDDASGYDSPAHRVVEPVGKRGHVAVVASLQDVAVRVGSIRTWLEPVAH